MTTVNLLTKLSMASVGAMLIALTSTTAKAEEIVNVGSQTGSFTGDTRGFWFVAPTNFTISGLGLPTDASTENFDVSVFRLNETPPNFSSLTTNFSTLFTSRDNVGSSLLDVNIDVSQGQIIGILGSRGNNSTNSYAPSNFVTQILGFDVTLKRLGMQQDLRFFDPSSIGVFTEQGSIGRVLMEVKSKSVKSVPEPASLIGILGLGVFGVTSLRKRKQSTAVKA